MPVNPSNYRTIPITFEPSLVPLIQNLANEIGYNRTKLMRMMVKYIIVKDLVRDVMANGDPYETVLTKLTPSKGKKK